MNRNDTALTTRRIRPTRLAAMMAIGGAALALAACGPSPQEEQTVGQQADGAIAQAERGIDNVRSETADTLRDAADAAKDTTITAAVKAQLMADSSLSAMDIEVTTEGGEVTLDGSAPDLEARERATELAEGVDGVSDVNNRLMIVASR
jgi:hyperosmotically inducible periplasmic protein